MASTVWRGHLTFGLVSFPVRLYSAARSETVGFNLLHKEDHSRIKQVTYCQLEDKPVSRDELVKGYEYEKGQYVVVEEEDVKKVVPKTARVMEILEFVKAQEVDPIYLETSYYMTADEGGHKPYALLFQALQDSGYYGLAKIAMHSREHVCILRPNRNGILLHTMYYQDEIRKVDEFTTDTGLVKPKELGLAKNLIEALVADFEPQKYEDSYRTNLQKMIEDKIEGRKVVATPEARVAPVVDIMEALKRSLAERKKPERAPAATRAEAPPPAAAKKSRKPRVA
ncbi:MAG: Ku protein [Acidobacteria bacterium]|nr:Ku protein [Acidobacteriota bacterium]